MMPSQTGNLIPISVGGVLTSSDSVPQTLPALQGGLGASVGSSGSNVGSLALPGTARTGNLLRSWFDEIREKILIKPRVTNLGTIFQTVVVEGVIWNTHQANRATLGTILVTGDPEGISLTGIDDGKILQATEDVVFQYTVITEGPLSFNVLYTFPFDVGTASQRLLGERGLVLISRPLENGYQESRQFDTEIVRAMNGLEDRASRFMDDDIPHRRIVMPIKAFTKRDASILQNVLDFGMKNIIAVPIWSSLTKLDAATVSDVTDVITCDTTFRQFGEVEKLVIISPKAVNHEVAVISTVEDDQITLTEPLQTAFAKGSFVLPIIVVTPSRAPDISFNTDRLIGGTITFDELKQPNDSTSNTPTDAGADAARTYLGYKVWEPTLRERIVQAPDNFYRITGDIHQQRVKVSRQPTEQEITVKVYQVDAEERQAIRQFFDYMRGKKEAFWFRSHRADFITTEIAEPNSTIILIEDADHVAGIKNLTRHVWIRQIDQFVKIVNQFTLSESEQINVSPKLTGQVKIGNQLERLWLVRLDTDSLSINWQSKGVDISEVTFKMRELQQETP